MAKALTDNHTIVTLILRFVLKHKTILIANIVRLITNVVRYNEIGLAGAQALAKVLIGNSSMTTFDISFVLI